MRSLRVLRQLGCQGGQQALVGSFNSHKTPALKGIPIGSFGVRCRYGAATGSPGSPAMYPHRVSIGGDGPHDKPKVSVADILRC